MREWARKNPEKAKANGRTTWKRHGAKYTAKLKAKYASDPLVRDAAIARAGKWQQDNRERRKAYMADYCQKNRAKMLEKTRLWELANPERAKLNARHYAHRRRERIQKAPADQAVLCKAIVARESGKKSHKCYYCQRRFAGEFHVDHILALSIGGTHEPSNIAISCPRCNLSKADKPLSHFIVNNQTLLSL